jgi:hypothetical protein
MASIKPNGGPNDSGFGADVRSERRQGARREPVVPMPPAPAERPQRPPLVDTGTQEMQGARLNFETRTDRDPIGNPQQQE